MPNYDRVCPNGHELIDCLEPIEAPTVPCPTCGKLTERAWIGKPSGVIGDDIPGGIWMRHGICNEDGSPRKYYSKSEIAKEAERRGLVNVVRHAPAQGTDKSAHTVRWVAAPVISEEDRLRHWHEHEDRLKLGQAVQKSS